MYTPPKASIHDSAGLNLAFDFLPGSVASDRLRR